MNLGVDIPRCRSQRKPHPCAAGRDDHAYRHPLPSIIRLLISSGDKPAAAPGCIPLE